MPKLAETNMTPGQPEATDEDEGLNMIAQIRSAERIYRKISTSSNQELAITQSSKFGQEIIAGAFSPDGTVFAWAVGTSTVCLHSVLELIPTLPVLSSSTSGVTTRSQVASWPQTQATSLLGARWQDAQGSKLVDLDVGGHGVTFLAFGQRASAVRRTSEVKYSRTVHNFMGDLVLAVGLGSGDIKIWDMANGKLTLFLQDHSDAITHLQFAPDGSFVLVSAAKDCTVKLWDLLDDGNMFKSLDTKPGQLITRVAFSPDAKRLAVVGHGKLVAVWELNHYKLEKNLQGHQNDVTGCDFSADGKLLYTSSFDTRVICWDVEKETIVRKFEHMSPPPTNIFAAGTNEHEVIAMDLKDNQLVTICNDGDMRVWNVSREKVAPVARVQIMPEALSVTLSPGAKVAAVACKGGFMQFYALE